MLFLFMIACGEESTDPTKEPIVLLKVVPIRLVGGHEQVHSLLEFEENEPVSHHEEEVPEEDCTEDVKQVDEGRD